MNGEDRDLISHVSSLRRYARALLGNESEADDLVQECLTRAIGRVHLWPAITNFRGYLFTILRNIYIDQLRARSRHGETVPLEDVPGQVYSTANQNEKLRLRDLERALQALPLEQREVVLLVGLEGASYKDAAEILDVPLGTVMSRLSRGREALRTAVESQPKFDRDKVVPLRRVEG